MNITICLDDNFVMPATVLIQSIGENNKSTHIDYYLISVDKLKDSSVQALKKETSKFDASLSFLVYDLPNRKELESLCHGRWSIATFLRLYLSELLPKDVVKVLYLDGDIIVRHDLSELWNTDLTNYAAGVVWDVAYPNAPFFINYERSLGYFNAGVMLINLDYDRKNHLLQNYIKFIKRHRTSLKYLDQDVLNNVLCDKKKILDIKYNAHWGHYNIFSRNFPFISDKKQVIDAYRDPYIVHFTNDIKPWHKYCRNIYTCEWDKYLSRTEFQGFNKTIITGDRQTLILYYIYKILSVIGIFKYLAFRL